MALSAEQLLEKVEALQPLVEAHWSQMEAERTLPTPLVEALVESGLLMMSAPTDVGGSDLSLVEQFPIYEAVGYLDASLCWVMATCGTGAGWPAAYLGAEVRRHVYQDGIAPKVSVSVLPAGRARPVDGGYMLSGQWGFASGVFHADWVVGGALTVTADGEKPQRTFHMMPTNSIVVVDNWDAAGLRGSGSGGFKVDDLFVPDGFSWQFGGQLSQPARAHHLGLMGFVINEHPALALGVARRALDEIIAVAKYSHSQFRGKSLADRQVFQKALAQADLRWQAARTLILGGLVRLWEYAESATTPPDALLAELRAIGSFVSKEAIDLTTIAFQYGGGRAIMSNNILQRCLRDIHAVSQHFLTSDVSLENYGQFLLELPGADLRG